MDKKYSSRLVSILVLVFIVMPMPMKTDAQESATSELDWEEPVMEEPFASEEALGSPVVNEEFIEADSEPIPVAPPVVTPVVEAPVAAPVVVGKKPVQRELREPLKKGRKLQEHPLSAKGLMRIEKDGAYIYRTETGVKDKSVSVRLSSMEPPALESADGTSDYQSMYGSSGVMGVLFDYETQPVTEYGKLGWQLGGGLFYSSGNGRFLVNGNQAREKYSFFTIPLNAGGIYRFEYMNRQWLAPYLSAGLSYIGMLEMRDDDASPKAVGTFGAYGSVGAMVNLTAMDRQMAFNLFSEYGVAAMWFVMEFRRQQVFSQDLDVSANIINAGVSVDY